jgi:hypothetical protein
VTSDIRLSGGFKAENFEVDGSLRDVCLLGVGIPIWERLLYGVTRSSWTWQFELDGESRELDDFSVRSFFAKREEGEDLTARLAVKVGEIWFDTFFFKPDEIEFSFDPVEIAGGQQFWALEQFMLRLADTCGVRVILTMETSRHDDIPTLLETISE